MKKEPLISLPVAAQRLQITWDRCWNLVLSGRLRGEKLNGRWLVDSESVEEEVQRRTVEVGT